MEIFALEFPVVPAKTISEIDEQSEALITFPSFPSLLLISDLNYGLKLSLPTFLFPFIFHRYYSP